MRLRLIAALLAIFAAPVVAQEHIKCHLPKNTARGLSLI